MNIEQKCENNSYSSGYTDTLIRLARFKGKP